jgi:glycosyltransferase involved in cell wall biosynthesis
VEPSADARRQPLVSCIVPVFNGARYLAEALDSALRQTYGTVEVLAVDDGSTDATPTVLASYGDRVRSVRQANAGPAAARNRGLREIRGEFAAFLDADDLWDAEKVARQMERFAARPELDISVTHVRNFWIPELRDEEARFRDHRIAQSLPGYLASTMLAPRRVFEAIGDFDAALAFGHSTEWFLRAKQHGAVIEALSDVLYFRRIHHDNRSRRLNDASRDEYLRLVRAHIERRRAHPAGGATAVAGPKQDPRR